VRQAVVERPTVGSAAGREAGTPRYGAGRA
jgi:hypothetical protein